MICGSPSLRRRRLMVTNTTLVKGSACSSHACSRRSSVVRKAGAARRRTSRTRGGLAAGQSAYSQDQLGEMERLGKVVIGAEAETADPVRGGVCGGEHEDHGRLVGLGDHPA